MAGSVLERITLWTLENEFIDPEYFGKIDVGGAITLKALRFTFESHDLLEWPFDFWDAEDKKRVKNKLERVNGFRKEMHVIQQVATENDANKRQRLIDGSFSAPPVEIVVAVEGVAAMEDASKFLEIEVTEGNPVILSVRSSRVSGLGEIAEVENNLLKSQLIPTHLMDRYLEEAKKLRAELKHISMDDHDLWLKTIDMNGSGVVKLWCAECKKDCGGGSKDHTKADIDNLFNNFRRSHIVSTLHVKNYCASKNVNFEDHQQSAAKNGRAVTVTPEDHKRLISEGVKIVEAVNASLLEGQKKFMVLGHFYTLHSPIFMQAFSSMVYTCTYYYFKLYV